MTKSEKQYSHPNCYANSLKNCSKKISREHYLSENILATYPSMKVFGQERIRKDKNGFSPKSSFASKILCKKHNSDLESLDKEAGKFFKHLLDVGSSKECPSNIIFNGEKIQLWLLKNLLGHYKAGRFPKSKFTGQQFESLVNILYEKEKWPEQDGLYFYVPKTKMAVASHETRISTSCMPDGQICGADFSIAGFWFTLSLRIPSGAKELIYRPIRFEFTQNTGEKKEVKLEWDNPKLGSWVEFKFQIP
jgi:hypothetical protein